VKHNAEKPKPRFFKLFIKLMRFLWHVIQEFMANQGLLLASALGYNALLSLIPLMALFFLVASSFADNEVILSIISAELKLVLPVQTESFTRSLAAVLEDKSLVGWVGAGALVFFSSIAFRMLENAMLVIFRHHEKREKRTFAKSLLIPLVYVTSIFAILTFFTLLTSFISGFELHAIELWGTRIPIDQWNGWLLSAMSFLLLVFLLSSFYRFMPVVRVRFRLALVGGLVAALLWEIVQRILVYYFENLSLVNVLYGSLATVIIILLSMEIAAVIILLGAQVISILEQNAANGDPWYWRPKNDASKNI